MLGTRECQAVPVESSAKRARTEEPLALRAFRVWFGTWQQVTEARDLLSLRATCRSLRRWADSVITVVTLRHDRDSPHSLQEVFELHLRFPALRELALRFSRPFTYLDEDVLRRFASRHLRLNSLDLMPGPATSFVLPTASQWRALRALTALADLDLPWDQLTVADVSSTVGSLGGLTFFSIQHLPAQLALPPMAGLSRLFQLELGSIETVDQAVALSCLSHLRNLSILDIPRLAVDEGYHWLARLTSLRELIIDEAWGSLPPSSRAVHSLSSLTRLELLKLGYADSALDNEGLCRLTTCQRLTRFFIHDSAVGEGAGLILGKFTRMWELDLGRTGVVGRDLVALCPLRLERLSVSECPRLGVHDLLQLTALTALERLHMADNPLTEVERREVSQTLKSRNGTTVY